MELYDKTQIKTELLMRKAVAEFEGLPKELLESDVIILHCPFDLIYLDWLKKPCIYYNHRSDRPHTSMIEELLKYENPLRQKVIRKDLPWIFKTFKELYQRADVIVSNSKFTQGLLQKYFGMDSFVVYPPVDIKKFRPCKNPRRNYFVSAQRINWQKRVDVQVEAFADVKQTLKIVGASFGQQELQELRHLAEPYDNIKILGLKNDKEMVKLFQNAKAVLSLGILEDFGLVPIESFACGTPTIVVDEGGFKETVHSSHLGIRIKPPYVENLRRAIQNFDGEYNPEVLRKEAEKYSIERFEKEMKIMVELAVERHGHRN